MNEEIYLRKIADRLELIERDLKRLVDILDHHENDETLGELKCEMLEWFKDKNGKWSKED